MLLAFILFIHVCAVGDTLILGAGPVGLWTAFKILQADPDVQVVIAEKRQEFLTRDYIVRAHPFLMPEICNDPLKCTIPKPPAGKLDFRSSMDFTIKPYTIKDLQTAILDRLDQYSSRFQIVKLNSLSGSASKVEISLDRVPFTYEFIPQTIIDSTGSKAELMSGILKVPHDPHHYYTHGSALHLAWPSRLNTHVSSRMLVAGPESATAIFANPFENSNELFTKWGFKVDPMAKAYPETNYHGGKLSAVFQLLSDPNVDQSIKTRLESIFIDIQKGGKNGIDGNTFFSRLVAIYRSLEKSDPAYTAIRQLAYAVINTSGLGANVENMSQLRITFIPQRVEKYLSEIKVDHVPVNINIARDTRKFQVSVLAFGDSLVTSDFSEGISASRGIAMANQIMGNGENANRAYEEMLKHTILTPGSIADRKRATFLWLLKPFRKI